MGKANVCVVGGGVIGLSSALRIIQTIPDVDVTVYAEHTTPFTTSDIAAGYWDVLGPSSAEEFERLKRWGVLTLKYWISLIKTGESGPAGVQYISGFRAFEEKNDYDVPYPMVRDMTDVELTEMFPGSRHGVMVLSLLARGKYYLPYLVDKFKAAGGKIVEKKVRLSDLTRNYDAVVNCTGLGAKEFVGDMSVYPIRGQVLLIEAPWLTYAISIRGNPYTACHILPCINTIVVGGTYQKHNWNTQVDPDDKKDILRRAYRCCPQLKGAKLLGDYVGLRPGRDTVRLESETMTVGEERVYVVHNYGHGGNGVSVSWGCALDTADLVRVHLHSSKSHL